MHGFTNVNVSLLVNFLSDKLEIGKDHYYELTQSLQSYIVRKKEFRHHFGNHVDKRSTSIEIDPP